MSGRWVALVLVSFGLILGSLWLVGVLPADAFRELVRGSFGTPRAIHNTLREITPLLITGLAVMVALKAGLFNIGAEGQFILGALASASIALTIGGPMGMGLGLAAGIAAGGLWAFPAGWIKAYRGGHEVITTIMLNNIAVLLARALVAGPLRDPANESPTTATLTPSSMLPPLWQSGPLKVNPALVFGLVVVGAFSWWLARTVRGYELGLVGANPTAARAAGVRTERVSVSAMCASGALAGLAGAVQVLAYQGRFADGLFMNYGFDSLGVALLAGTSPWGLIPAAAMFGALNQGSTAMTLIGVPRGITGVLLGLLIVVFAALRYRKVQTHD